MYIKEVSKRTGVTVRALHYYDEILLLSPSDIGENGYRIYKDKDIAKLQQILFFRELDFSLAKIKEIISSDNFDEKFALSSHKKILEQKRNRINNLINVIDDKLKGSETMSFEEFDNTEIENTKKKYEKEVKERWGETKAYAQSAEKTKGYTKENYTDIQEKTAEIFIEFSENMDKNPQDEKIQKLVEKWQQFITDNFYECNKEILANLGQMYMEDERFAKNLNSYGEGSAEFISKSIKFYCEN